MSEIIVRALGEEDWRLYRDIRLAALRDSPEAFVASVEQEEALEEQVWRERMRRSRRMLAERAGSALGVVSLGRGGQAGQAGQDGQDGQDAEPYSGVGELFGLWVAPQVRGTGVAWKLVEAGAAQARTDGLSQLGYWVGTDNGRAVAFASSFGFRPTGTRRPMRVPNETDGAQEMVMILPLGADPGTVPITAFR